jgi:glucose/arabinose dehydrogenase
MALLAVTLIVPAKAGAVTLQPVGAFDQPIYVTSDPANPNRLFVVQRAGLIKVVQGGSASTFADLTSVVRCCDGERGLFSIALAPDFPQTGRFYVYYTGFDGPGNLHIAELRASGNTASIGTLRNILTIPHSQANNHNGGQLEFGPDGYLYIATGDGGSTPANGQNTNSLLGKLLRIDPRQSGSSAYTVPSSNPFVGIAGADEIWAYGLRNPWRFSFDRQTRALLLADVGSNNYEEVDYATLAGGLGRGANYGWAVCEGRHVTGSATPCALAGRTDPIFEYPTHVDGTCAITGGYVVRDPTLGDLFGRYLYADLCLGQIRSNVPGLPAAVGDRAEGAAVSSPVSFGEDSCGRLYVVAQAANVYRLTGTGTPPCAVLRVSVRGSGHGKVTGPGIRCPRDCTEVFSQPVNVKLKKHAGKRSRFLGWHRACSGHRPCSVEMSQDRHVVARFAGPLRTRLRLTTADSVVPRGDKALLRVRAKPCKGRRHDKAKLFRGHKRIATKRLNRNCVARFRPRIERSSQFKAKVPADKRHFAGRSGTVLLIPRG